MLKTQSDFKKTFRGQGGLIGSEKQMGAVSLSKQNISGKTVHPTLTDTTALLMVLKQAYI